MNYYEVTKLLVLTASPDDLIADFESQSLYDRMSYLDAYCTVMNDFIPEINSESDRAAIYQSIAAANAYNTAMTDARIYQPQLTEFRRDFLIAHRQLKAILIYLFENPPALEVIPKPTDNNTNLQENTPGVISHISLSDKNYYTSAPVEEVLFLEANSSYTRIKLQNGTVNTVSKQLKEYESILPQYFVRVSRSIIVNINYITKLSRGKDLIIMSDKSEI